MGIKLLGTLVLATAVSIASPVSAQSEMDTGARLNLLHQAADASASNDHARALDLARRAAQISMTISVRMFIAQEEVALGQSAAAYNDAGACVNEARRDTTTRNRDTILAQCQAILLRVEPHLGHVTLVVPAPAAQGLRVTVAGVPVNEAFYGAPYIVTAGDVIVHATANDGRVFDATVAVGEGSTITVPIVLSGPAPAERVIAEPRPVGSPSPAASSEPLVATQTSTSSGRTLTPQTNISTSPVPFVVMIVGALGLIASGVMYGLSVGDASRIENGGQCTRIGDAYECDPSAMATGTQGQSLSVGSLAALGVGAGLVVIGGAWWLLTRHHSSHEHARLIFAPTVGGAVFGIRGDL